MRPLAEHTCHFGKLIERDIKPQSVLWLPDSPSYIGVHFGEELSAGSWRGYESLIKHLHNIHFNAQIHRTEP